VPRILLIGLSAALLVALGVGSALARDTKGQPAPTKPRQLFMNPAGTESGHCTRIDPCASFPSAYRVARAGDIVELAAGTYDAADQSIPYDSSKKVGNPVIFRPAPGASVTITAEVKVAAARIFFKNMRFAGGWYATGDRLTFKNINAAGMDIISGTNIRVLGGQVYPGTQFQGEQDNDPLIASRTNGPPPTNILIDGVWFHGWLRPPGSDYHTECFQAGSGVNVVVRRSRFSDCATHDLFIQSWGTLNGADNRLDNWVLENNFLGKTHDGYYSLQLLNGNDQSGKAASFLIRNNSWAEDVHIDVRDETTVNLIANVGVQSQNQCGFSKGRIEWSYNVFTAARCGKTDRRAPARFVDVQTLDLRLEPGAAAKNHGDPLSYPPIDIFGNKRPRGVKPDAGAVEVG
jgi:hypothetical protein